MKLKIALLQIASFGMDGENNLNKGIEAFKKVKDLGADLALFPEEWNIGYSFFYDIILSAHNRSKKICQGRISIPSSVCRGLGSRLTII